MALTLVPYIYYQIAVNGSEDAVAVNIAEIKLLDALGNDMLRDGVADSGTATASSSYGGGYGDPAAAFGLDPMANNYGWMNAGGNSGWLRWESAGTIDVVGVSVMCLDSEPTRAPKDFTIEYSDNESSWTTVHTVTNSTGWAAAWEARYWAFSSGGSHKYWRINVTNTSGPGGYVRIASLRFHLADGTTVASNDKTTFVWATSNDTNPIYRPLFVLDGNNATHWAAASGVMTPEFNMVLPRPLAANAIAIRAESVSPGRSPKNFTIKAKANIGDAWTDLLAVVDETGWIASELRTFGDSGSGGDSRRRMSFM